MNCNQVMSALATGGTFRRWRARRHAASCPRCAEAQAALRQIAEELSATPPLSPEERSLWIQAIGEAPSPGRARFPLWRPALALSAAAAVALAVLWLRPPPRGPAPDIPGTTVHVQQSPVLPVATVRELDDMQAGLRNLERELDTLRRQADLLDARRDADALWARYALPEKNATGTAGPTG